jgi:hypothetical protein
MTADKPGENGSPKPSPSEEDVDRTRAWTGLFVVVGGDVAIVVAAVVAVIKFAGSTANANNAVIASILSSAFAAIGTMTTAFFGIRESANTAQRSVKHQSETPNP